MLTSAHIYLHKGLDIHMYIKIKNEFIFRPMLPHVIMVENSVINLIGWGKCF